MPDSKTITLIIEGGVIHEVCDIPHGIEVCVHDYDTEGMEDGDVTKDPEGREYYESRYYSGEMPPLMSETIDPNEGVIELVITDGRPTKVIDLPYGYEIACYEYNTDPATKKDDRIKMCSFVNDTPPVPQPSIKLPELLVEPAVCPKCAGEVQATVKCYMVTGAIDEPDGRAVLVPSDTIKEIESSNVDVYCENDHEFDCKIFDDEGGEI